MKAAKTCLLWLLLALTPLQSYSALTSTHCPVAVAANNSVHHHHAGMAMPDAAASPTTVMAATAGDHHAQHAAASSWCARACAAAGSGALLASLPFFVSVIAHDSPRITAGGTPRDALAYDLLRPPTALS